MSTVTEIRKALDDRRIEQMEFESHVPCEHPHTRGEDAVWYLVCKDCKNVLPLCEAHRVRLSAEISARPTILECSKRLVRSFEDGFDIVPINPKAHR